MPVFNEWLKAFVNDRLKYSSPGYFLSRLFFIMSASLFSVFVVTITTFFANGKICFKVSLVCISDDGSLKTGTIIILTCSTIFKIPGAENPPQSYKLFSISSN